MPLHRRLPKRGFTNVFAPVTKEITLSAISVNYKDGDTVSIETLREKKLVSSKVDRVVVIASGGLSRKVVVDVYRVTKGAKESIISKGGSVKEPAITDAES